MELHQCVLKKPFGLSFEESEGRPLVVGVHSRQAREAGVALHAVLMQVGDTSLEGMPFDAALREVTQLPSGVGVRLTFGPLLRAGAEMF